MPRSARTAALVVVVALLTLLPFVGGDYYIHLFALVTVAFVEAVRLIASIWVPLTRGNAGLSGVPKPSILGMTLVTKTSQYYLGLVLMLVVLVILAKLERSRLGLVWKSIGLADN